MTHFIMDVRKSDGEHYRTTSLSCLKCSLNRHLKAPPYNKTFDIGKNASFANSREKVKAAIAEFNMMGLGDVQLFPAINEN